jgi:flagellar biosynthesis/type III secretory pathway protein FliH
MKTTYERGIEQGIERGIEQGIERGIEQGIERGIEQGIERGIEQGIERGMRRAALRQMEKKFGPLSAEVQRRVEALSPEALARLQLDLLDAQTLEELRLDD